MHLQQISRDIPRWILRLCTFLYYKSFKKNTLDAVDGILQEHDDPRLQKRLESFSRAKMKESQYVQVAVRTNHYHGLNPRSPFQGAVIFSSVTSSLSWPSIPAAHWTVPALLYSSIVFALLAVVLGAQQQRVLPSIHSDASLACDIERIRNFRDRLRAGDGKNSNVVFALQSPLMMFTLSVASFLAALCALILSPIVLTGVWNDDAKVSRKSVLMAGQMMTVPYRSQLLSSPYL